MKFNHSMTKEQKATYARHWRLERKSYVPQECNVSNCSLLEHRRGYCQEHYKELVRLVRGRTYNIWCNMRARCNNPKNPSYKNYGGRGIKVCERWHFFLNFYFDMGASSSKMEIDRIDNDGDYTPENCRWATKTEQANNKRGLIYFEKDGQVKSLAVWCRQLGISYGTVHSRVHKWGWSISQALGLEER